MSGLRPVLPDEVLCFCDADAGPGRRMEGEEEGRSSQKFRTIYMTMSWGEWGERGGKRETEMQRGGGEEARKGGGARGERPREKGEGAGERDGEREEGRRQRRTSEKTKRGQDGAACRPGGGV